MNRSHGPTGRSDDSPVARWVRLHGPAIRSFIWMSVRDIHLTDDIVQEVFCRAWKHRERYAEVERERALLIRIADRLVCDRARSRRREACQTETAWENVAAPDDHDQPFDALCRRETQVQLMQALDQLSESQKRVLLMRFYGPMEFHEIAEQLGCPLNTVLSHCHRGLQALRRHLAETQP